MSKHLCLEKEKGLGQSRPLADSKSIIILFAGFFINTHNHFTSFVCTTGVNGWI